MKRVCTVFRISHRSSDQNKVKAPGAVVSEGFLALWTPMSSSHIHIPLSHTQELDGPRQRLKTPTLFPELHPSRPKFPDYKKQKHTTCLMPFIQLKSQSEL